MNIDSILNIGASRQPSSQEEISNLERKVTVPDSLLALYGQTDGFMMPSGVNVYGVSDIIERNTTFELHIYSPGYILIGDDSGGRGFLLNQDEGDSSVYSSDLADLDPSDFEVEADSVEQWLSSLQ
ncbi:SMI1/KNR4 family protein [Williamsia sp. CHRR-6]|uniref:SMI1/KNR4 family protein n=1 Tax=Williamsia sp. CHRR-6 TaxID=2835871 RepID=UPI001BDA86CC|nr:SMI1/KNR4 family protein [Williamsia sp. CHRR-6]MBT0567593.1 SMI1/KNR4 family protein [Williamsia sp. CHRR-6]